MMTLHMLIVVSSYKRSEVQTELVLLAAEKVNPDVID
jgi:hypothetical protein